MDMHKKCLMTPLGRRIVFEDITPVDLDGSATFTEPIDHLPGENVAYLGHGFDHNPGSSTFFLDITWDGAASDYSVGAEDNTDEENITAGIGIKNITDGDWTKVAYHSRTNPNGATYDFMAGTKIIGGTTPLYGVYSDAVGNLITKQYSTNVLKGDLIFLMYDYRISGGSLSISNPNLELLYSFNQSTSNINGLYFYEAEVDETFTVTISHSGAFQQYVSAFMVLRYS